MDIDIFSISWNLATNYNWISMYYLALVYCHCMWLRLYFFCSQETVETLLRHQADVNARDKNWQTPLHIAAANNAVRCAEYLIPLLTNVNVSDRAGRTSLQHASFNGHKEVTSLVNQGYKYYFLYLYNAFN